LHKKTAASPLPFIAFWRLSVFGIDDHFFAQRAGHRQRLIGGVGGTQHADPAGARLAGGGNIVIRVAIENLYLLRLQPLGLGILTGLSPAKITGFILAAGIENHPAGF
jgi:hypothetical protein